LLGVVLLGEGGATLDPVGVLFALIAAAGWASYILVSRRTGQQSSGIDGLAVAMAVAALAVAPVGLRAGAALIEPHVLAVGALVALLAGLVPFSLELVALRSVPPRVFGVLMSLSPVAAAASGAVLLGEHLGGVQLLAMGMVVLASVGTVLADPAARADAGAPADDLG
jgi:inner membrane transporter RhtA